MSAAVREILAGVVGPDTLRPEGEAEQWRTGPGPGGLPAAVLLPASEEELAQVLGVAGEEGWPVMPAGSGRWLEGGGSSDVILVLSTRRIREMDVYEPADLTFTAGAGLTLAELTAATAPNGQWLPLDPPGWAVGTLGAAVAIGGNGSLRHLYGTARDHILGLTLVSGEGEILRWGGRVVKNVAGFDMTRLFTGSWGTLGVITSVSGRLFPIPERDVTLVFRCEDAKRLAPAARSVALSSMPVAAVELLHPLRSGGVLPNEASTAEDDAGLVVRLLGSEAVVGEMEARLRRDLAGELSEPDRLSGEASRAVHAGLGDWEAGADLVARLRLLPSELPTLLAEAESLGRLTRESSEGDSRCSITSHVGAGVLRFAVWGMPSTNGVQDHWSSALAELRGRLENGGGSLVLSRGPEAVTRRIGAWGGRGEEAPLVDGLKAEFDPHGIMAPGRLGL